MKNNRIMIIVAIVAIGGAVAYFGLKGKFPPASGTEGAIGAANRYTAQQIADQDVALKNPDVQAFLQSDTFHQLATNADFRTMVKDGAFNRVAEYMASKEVEGFISNPRKIDDGTSGAGAPRPRRNNPLGQPSRWTGDRLAILDGLRLVSADKNVISMPADQRQVLFSKAMTTLLADQAYVAMLGDQAFQTAAKNGKLDALSGKLGETWDHFKMDPNQQVLTADNAWAPMVGGDALHNLIEERTQSVRAEESHAQMGVIDLLAIDGFAQISDGFRAIAFDPAVQQMVSRDEYKVVDNAVFADALNHPPFIELLRVGADFGKLIGPEQQ